MFSLTWFEFEFWLTFSITIKCFDVIYEVYAFEVFFVLVHELGLAFDKRMQLRLRADMKASACIIKSNSFSQVRKKQNFSF